MDVIPNPIVKRAFLTPDRPMIVFQNQEYSYGDIYERAYKTAGHIQSQGVKKGSHVAVLLKNHLDSIVIFLSLQMLGAVAIILNGRLTTSEISWQIKDAKCMLLLTQTVFTNTVDTNVPVLFKERLSAVAFEKPVIQEEVQLRDVCSIMYTSGTTGKPKGVIQTYGNHWWSATGSLLNLGLNEKDCWLCSLPLFHISGFSIMMRSVQYGMKMVLHENFNECEMIKAIKEEKVTIVSLVTTMLNRLLDVLSDNSLPTHVRCILLGGGPAPLPLLERCAAKLIPVYQSYGMTETSSQIVTLAPEDSLKRLGSAGKVLFPAQLMIMDDEGNAVARNDVGEIVVKGPNVTPGYLYREEQTKELFQNDWLKTGDIGYLDDEGFLYVLDRRSDLIISGGENVYPAEIEGFLTSHELVEDAGVIGVTDNRWGEVPVAFVKVSAVISEAELLQFCAEGLAKYKHPRHIYFVEEIPRNAAKKLLRRELRNYLN